MHFVKGFITIQSYINNSLNVVSTVGELSTYARTFSKDIREFKLDFSPNLIFSCFHSKENGQDVAITPIISSHIISISHHIYDFVKNYSGNLTSMEIGNNVIYSFAGQINNLTLGNLVEGAGLRTPEWVSWSNPLIPNSSFKVWFSEPAFVRQYDEYEIVVIPPVQNLDDLFRDLSVVDNALAQRPNNVIFDLIQDAKQRKPETSFRGLTFEYNNNFVANSKRKLTWSCLIYGQAGDNEDAIREAIINHAYENSSFSYNDYRQIIPDLFRRTEFYLFPNWNNYAIANRTTQAGIYSPIINVSSELTRIKSYFDPTVFSTHINNNLENFSHPYRSINISVFGGLDNKDSKFKLTDYFPDYINVGFLGSDNSRMSENTIKWQERLQQILIVAENNNDYSDLPSNMRRVIRNNKTFISSVYDNIYFLIEIKPTI